MKINKKRYSSVTEMLRDTLDDQAFVADFEKHVAETRIAAKLFVLRNSRGLSEQDVAKKMGCRPSRVSKLEHGKDADLRLGDLFAYLAALEMDANIVVYHKNRPTRIETIFLENPPETKNGSPRARTLPNAKRRR